MKTNIVQLYNLLGEEGALVTEQWFEKAIGKIVGVLIYSHFIPTDMGSVEARRENAKTILEIIEKVDGNEMALLWYAKIKENGAGIVESEKLREEVKLLDFRGVKTKDVFKVFKAQKEKKKKLAVRRDAYIQEVKLEHVLDMLANYYVDLEKIGSLDKFKSIAKRCVKQFFD